MTEPVKLGIVGLGRWAKVLTRASRKSDKIEIVAGYSRSEDKRAAFAHEFGVAAVPDLETMLADPAIRGVILTVGFAFDVNAGMKPDAPLWMQRVGLTWVFRLASEPRRLLGRYLRYNFLFLFYLAVDGLRGRAWGKVDRQGQ